MPKEKQKNPIGQKSPIFYTKFPKLSEIQCYLKQIAKEFPKIIRLEQIGSSLERRSIDMVIIQKNQSVPKMGTMIEGGIHAREWLGHTTVLYFIDYIIQHPEMLDDMDYYIIPCLNPDGYVYTHTRKRLWRKNMNKNGCRDEKNWGVDVNRNFSFGYGRAGSSPNPSHRQYRGEKALSEPESRSIAHALRIYGTNIKLYIAIHCFGNLILYPWGFTKRRICDECDLRNCGAAAVRAMKCADGDSCYRVGSLWKLMYVASGGSIDYARGAHDIKFSYTMELHKGGKHGFDPPASIILKVAKETVIGIEAMIRFVHLFYTCKKCKSSNSASPHPCKRRKCDISEISEISESSGNSENSESPDSRDE